VYLGEPYAFLMKFSYLSKKKLGGKGKREGGGPERLVALLLN
jgi:hypothetical protein